MMSFEKYFTVDNFNKKYNNKLTLKLVKCILVHYFINFYTFH